MSSSESTDAAGDSRLDEVLAEYMQRLDRGEAVDREQFLAEHPDLTDELRSYFESAEQVEQMAGPRPDETVDSGGSSAAAHLCLIYDGHRIRIALKNPKSESQIRSKFKARKQKFETTSCTVTVSDFQFWLDFQLFRLSTFVFRILWAKPLELR